MESTCTCTVKPKSRQQRHKGRKKNPSAVPHNPGVSTGLWRYRCDHVSNAVLTKREELPLRWKLRSGREGVRDSMKNSKEPFEYWWAIAVSERMDKPRTRVQRNETHRLEILFGGGTSNWLFRNRCKDQTEIYNTTRKRFRLGCFRGNDRLEHVLCKD